EATLTHSDIEDQPTRLIVVRALARLQCAVAGQLEMVWRHHLNADPHVLRADLTATEALTDVHRLISWLRLLPHADPIEIRTRAAIPQQYLARIAALAD